MEQGQTKKLLNQTAVVPILELFGKMTLNKKGILYTEIFSSLVSFQDLLSDFSSINVRMRYTQES